MNQQFTFENAINLNSPTNGFMCKLKDNKFALQFLKFQIKDHQTGELYYDHVQETLPNSELIINDDDYDEEEEEEESDSDDGDDAEATAAESHMDSNAPPEVIEKSVLLSQALSLAMKQHALDTRSKYLMRPLLEEGSRIVDGYVLLRRQPTEFVFGTQ